jgi:hypothetical protein
VPGAKLLEIMMTLHAELFGEEGPAEEVASISPAGRDWAYYEMFREFNSERSFLDFARTLQSKPHRGSYGAEGIAKAG